MGCINSKDESNEESKEVPKDETKEVPMEDSKDISEDKKYINIYKDCTDENTPLYTYENLKTYVKILKIIDGDTVDIALYYENLNKIFKHRVRLYGIDTPEKRPLKSNVNREKEIEESKKSTLALTNKIEELNNIVLALFYKPDKYGRLLCTFYDKNNNSINDWMIKEGFAYEYFGKTKKKFE